MIDLGPPPLIVPPRPAIVRHLGEPWEHRVGRDLARAGLPLGARLAVLAELRRLVEPDGKLVAPALGDLSRWSGVKLAMLPGMTPICRATRALVITYQTYAAVAGSATSTYTFTSVAIGTASVDRQVVVAFCAESSSALSGQIINSATVGGISGTRFAHFETVPSSRGIALAMFVAPVPTGTTADIVMNFTGTFSSGRVVAVWYMTGDLLNATAVGSGSAEGTSPSVSGVATRAYGAAFALGGVWSGATPTLGGTLTQNFSGGSATGGKLATTGATVSASTSDSTAAAVLLASIR